MGWSGRSAQAGLTRLPKCTIHLHAGAGGKIQKEYGPAVSVCRVWWRGMTMMLIGPGPNLYLLFRFCLFLETQRRGARTLTRPGYRNSNRVESSNIKPYRYTCNTENKHARVVRSLAMPPTRDAPHKSRTSVISLQQTSLHGAHVTYTPGTSAGCSPCRSRTLEAGPHTPRRSNGRTAPAPCPCAPRR